MIRALLVAAPLVIFTACGGGDDCKAGEIRVLDYVIPMNIPMSCGKGCTMNQVINVPVYRCVAIPPPVSSKN